MLNLITCVNNDLCIFEDVSLRLSDVSAFYKTVIPATHASPEMYLLSIIIKGAHEPIHVTADDKSDLDAVYDKFVSLYVGV